MGRESTQKKIERVRPPRVQISYDVETGGAIEMKELPFVMGILGDFTGMPIEPLAKLAVEPADFPLRIRGYDMATQLARVDADPGGFPWLAEDEV